MGVHRSAGKRLGRSVRVRLLQPDAHLGAYRADSYGAVQTEKLVQLLPDGLDDSAYLQIQAEGKTARESRKIKHIIPKLLRIKTKSNDHIKVEMLLCGRFHIIGRYWTETLIG